MTPGTPVRVAAAILLAAALAGCARGPELTITPRTISGKPLRIWTVHAEDKGDIVLVSGMVRRPALAHGSVPGHLHVVASFADGRPDIVADTRWGSIPARGSRTAYYSARLPIADASAVNTITVSYVGSADTADTPSGNNP